MPDKKAAGLFASLGGALCRLRGGLGRFDGIPRAVPRFCGGVFRWLDTLGSARYLDLAASYEHLGPLYTATDGLREKARQNATYYPEVAPARPSGSLKCA